MFSLGSSQQEQSAAPPEEPAAPSASVGSETMDNKRAWKSIAGVGLKDAFAGEAKPMVLICAGLGRTGTSSLKLAMKLVGLTPYHMADGVMETKGLLIVDKPPGLSFHADDTLDDPGVLPLMRTLQLSGGLEHTGRLMILKDKPILC